MLDMEYSQGGVLVPKNPKRPEFREVATTHDGRDITRGYVDALPLLPPLDSVLAARGGSYEIYEELLRDDQVYACFDQLKSAVVEKEVQVDAGSTSRKDKAAAAFIKEQIEEANFDAASDRMTFAAFYGYSVAELMFAREGSYITLPEIKVRKPRRFGFGAKDKELRLLTLKNPFGEPVHPRKFWHFTYGGDSTDEPYGLGMAHALYWPVLFKRNGIKFWLTFLDKFGGPTGVGKFPPGSLPEEKERLLAAVRALRQDTGVIIPDGMAIDLLEAARSGTADYATLCDRMDAAIAKVILSQTASTQGTPGRLGNDDTQQEALERKVKGLCDLQTQSFNRGPVRWLTEWNFPGANPPKVWRRTEEDEDLNARAERDKIIFDMGFKPTLQSIQETYPGEWEAKAAELPPPGGPTDPGGEAFAEGQSPISSDQPLAGLLVRQADTIVAGWVEQIQKLVNSASSFSEIEHGLLEMFPQLQTDELVNVIEEALATSYVAGMADVQDQSDA